MKTLLIACLLLLATAATGLAHTSETRVVSGGYCQIRYAAIATIWSGDHMHFWGPWYFMACHW
jgi:hypothetical protein